MKKATVVVELTAETLIDLNNLIENLPGHIVSYYVDGGKKDAEHPSDASKATDAKEPDLPSGTVRSSWTGGPGPI